MARKHELTAADSLSLDAQAARIAEHCRVNGWELVDCVRDHDVRGYDADRPGLNAVLARASSVDAVAVFALSRLARDNILQEVIWRRLRDAGCRLVSVSEPAAEDELVRGILGVVSQAERRRMGRMIAAAGAERRQRGHLHGRIPYGYRSVDGAVVLHDDEAATVRLIFDLAEGGASASAICRELERLGVRPRFAPAWNVSTVIRMLRNPVFGGMASLAAGGVVAGQHPALVDEPRRAAIAERVAGAPRVRHKVGTSWLEGRVRHACGARMYLMIVARRPDERIGMLRCAALKGERPDRCREPLVQVSVSRVEWAAREAIAGALAAIVPFEAAVAAAVARAGGDGVARERAASERDRAR
ncbi:recombinase family protein, partial [Nocardioides sp.]|uniref:recombinase family protein n=1 Tax=Nocardioides sp. TaxID=35761 RepID=UPI002C67057E